METIKNSKPHINRPGGFSITDKAMSLCMFKEGAKILDVGCGSGATVDYLRNQYGFEAFGIDINTELKDKPSHILGASSTNMPFPEASMDGIFMECSFSVMDSQEIVLKECNRVLNDNGFLVISDMYARGEQACLKGCLGNIYTRENLLSLIENNDFMVKHVEDFSSYLMNYWGQMIFENGMNYFYQEIGADAELMKKIKCGYCLIIATKKEQIK